VNITRHSKTGADCDWHGALNHRIVSTHNVYLVNEHDSFSKHRCYRYDDKCVCECLNDDQFYQDGTLQGKSAGIKGIHEGGNDPKAVTWSGKPRMELRQGHRGNLVGNVEQTITSLKAEDSFWKAPQYYVTDKEIDAARKCCAETAPSSAKFLIGTHDCASVQVAKNWQIKDAIEAAEPTITNTEVKRWLHKKGCYAGEIPESHHKKFDAWVDGENHHDDDDDHPHEISHSKYVLATKDEQHRAELAKDFCSFAEINGKVVQQPFPVQKGCQKCSKRCKGSFDYEHNQAGGGDEGCKCTGDWNTNSKTGKIVQFSHGQADRYGHRSVGNYGAAHDHLNKLLNLTWGTSHYKSKGE